MAGVTLKGVQKRFDGTVVIRDLDLEVKEHEFMVLVGPSGCGKTTVLRMIAGLEEISGGTIAIGDRVVNDLAPKDRDIAMVFQNYALYPHMTVRQNLEFGLKIRRAPRSEIDRLVNHAAKLLGIDHLLERKPRALSGGQRQRVALGRAIVRQPAVFLFDEPLSNLDARQRVQMRAEIAKLQQRLQTTTIYVTHDQVEAMTMGQRVAVLKDGELKQVGTPMELYNRPATVFVAGFIGTPPMNLLVVAITDGGATLAAPTFNIPVPARLRAVTNAHLGRRLVVGVRPENILAAKREGSGETAAVKAEVEIAEHLGSEVIVHTRVGDDLLVARLESIRHLAPGEKVDLVVELDTLHLFDFETGHRLELVPGDRSSAVARPKNLAM
jgi:multiple sugar transport system ATP-binding protein